MAKANSSAGKTIRVRLYKSINGCQARHRTSVRALGLRKLNDTRELVDSPSVRGLVNQVGYLVRIED
jgi:large subunit ribosomal protein L30